MPIVNENFYFNEKEIQERQPEFYSHCKKKGLKFDNHDFPVNLKTGEVFSFITDVKPDVRIIEQIEGGLNDTKLDLTNPNQKIYNIGNIYRGNGCSLTEKQKELFQQLNHAINERNKNKNATEQEDLICVRGGYGAGFTFDEIEEASNQSKDLYCYKESKGGILLGYLFTSRSKVIEINSNIINKDALNNFINDTLAKVSYDLINKIIEAGKQKGIALLTEEEKENALDYLLLLDEINCLINNQKNENIEQIKEDLYYAFEQILAPSQRDWETLEKLLEKYNIKHEKPNADLTQKLPENSKVLDEWKNYLSSQTSINNNPEIGCNFKNMDTKAEAKSSIDLTGETTLKNSKLLPDDVRTQRSFTL